MKSTGFWSTYPCDSKFTSVCMVINSLYTTPITTPTTPPLKCASGWTEGDGRCHKVNN